jgi:hypothetical protein
MFLNTRSLALAIAAASIVILFASSERASAQQQDVDAVRAKCLNQMSAAFPNIQPDRGSRAALEMYITCMRDHGLAP